MNKVFSELTKKEIQELSNNELLELDLKEIIGKIKRRDVKYRKSLNHLFLQFILLGLSLFLNTPILPVVLGSIIVLTSIITFNFYNKLKTTKMSLLMTLSFYRSSGIINELNEYVVERNLKMLR